MGYVPTHGPGCEKVHAFPTPCKYCSASLIYFECTCGSKVFLEPPSGGRHDCPNWGGERPPDESRPRFAGRDVRKIAGEIVFVSTSGYTDSDGKRKNKHGKQKFYHRIGCKHGERIPRGHIRAFENGQEAEHAGYKPCKTCKAGRVGGF